MSSLEKAKRRDKKRNKAQYGHKIDGKSIFLIQRIQIEKAKKAKENCTENEVIGRFLSMDGCFSIFLCNLLLAPAWSPYAICRHRLDYPV